MDIIKYFYEEPASLEVLTPDEDADARRRAHPAPPRAPLQADAAYYRGYLAGTALGAGRIGLTAVDAPAAFVEPLRQLVAGRPVARVDADGGVEPLGADALAAVLRDPGGTALLAAGDALPPADLAAASAADRRHALAPLRRLLDAGALVLVPEPAHHGADWSLFAAHPLRDALTDALRTHRPAGTRVFALPFQRARSEHRFYFELYDVEQFADFEVA